MRKVLGPLYVVELWSQEVNIKRLLHFCCDIQCKHFLFIPEKLSINFYTFFNDLK